MDKIAGFIVKHRLKILIFMLILSILCAFLMTKVYINADMSKYLPDDSNMKQGVDRMEQEFPDTAVQNTVRVMFCGLTPEEIPEVEAQLAQIEYVSAVDYEADSENYNRAPYTLFILSTEYDYGSKEETALQKSVLDTFADFDVTVKNDSANTGELPFWIVAVALVLGLGVLCAMCPSWAEPFLFLATLGIAVILNMGTNIFLGSISVTTFSIAAILQMVLSMDYSIILMNRYRQELLLTQDRMLAMANAWKKAFASICSSGLTTVVGLIMLVFMNFKIGFDIGVVLAKGVLLGMICVLTILPSLILMGEGLINKTLKKEANVPLYKLAGFGFKFRKPMVAVALLLFLGGYLLQSQVSTTYSLYMEDPIADIFPKSNPVVLLYANEDEEAASAFAGELAEMDGVDSVMSYGTTLGSPFTSQQMADTVKELAPDADLDASLLDILYYDYYTDGELPLITASEFIRFIADDVVSNDTFSDYLDAEMTDSVDLMVKFSDPEELTRLRTSADMAAFFGMNADDLEQLYLYYFLQHGGVNTGTMTLPVFANFVLNEVATDPAYAGMFDQATLAQMQQLAVFTNVNTVTTPKTYTQLADLLGIDDAQMYLLFVYYQSMNTAYQPSNMTLPAFTAFLKNNVATNPTFSAMMDPETLAQIDMLAAFTDTATIQAPMGAAQLAQLLGLDASTVEQILCLAYGSDTGTMTLPQFTGFVTGTVLANPNYASQFDAATLAQLQGLHQMLTAAQAGTALSYSQIAAMLGMDAGQCKQLFYLYYSAMDVSGYTMTLNGFLGYLLSDVAADPVMGGAFDAAQLAQLQQLYSLTTLAASGQVLDAAGLSAVTGIDQSSIQMIFRMLSMQAGTEITGMTLTDFLATMTAPPFSNMMDPAQLAQLQATSQLVQAAASGAALTPAQLAATLGMEQSAVNQVFVLYYSAQQTMTLPQFTGFVTGTVMNDPVYGAQFDAAAKAQMTGLHQMISAAAAGTGFSAAQMAQMMGMDESLAKLVYRWYSGAQTANKTMTPAQLVNLLLTDSTLSAQLDAATRQQLQMLQKLMQAALSGSTYSPAQMAQLLGMEEDMIRLVYTYHAAQFAINNWTVSLQTMVNFLVGSGADLLPKDNIAQLRLVQALINGSVNGTRYTPDGLANLLGMDAGQLKSLYLLSISRHGDTSGWLMSVEQFVDFVVAEVLTDTTLSAQLDAGMADQLRGLQKLIDAVLSGLSYRADRMYGIFSGLSDDLDQNSMELLYLYYGGSRLADPTWTMSILGLFDHLQNSILPDPRFADFIDADTRAQVTDMQTQLEDAVAQMQGENYSLMMIDTSLPIESAETSGFIRMLHERCSADLTGSYYLIGNSPMNYEMEQSFDKEMLLITLLTALSIFLVVAFTFRSVIIPLILVLLVQCGVYLTITVSGMLGYSIYYLAMLIVQCILMGATIDYAILFTNYYREHRVGKPIKEALVSAYKGSTHTIMCSGLVIIIATAVIAVSPADVTIRQICQTLSIGALMACLLILLVLPGLLAAFDKLIVKKKQDEAAEAK